MANKYRIKFNKDRCISCHACLVHCKQKNHMPKGVSLNQLTVSLEDNDGKPVIRNKYQPCLMCKKPLCVPACPQGALSKRDEDGMVLLDQSLCDGCGACVEACTFGAMVMNTDTGRAYKCDYCIDRIEAGLDPACVTGCTGKALSLARA